MTHDPRNVVPSHVTLAAALARGFHFDPDAPIEPPAAETAPADDDATPLLDEIDVLMGDAPPRDEAADATPDTETTDEVKDDDAPGEATGEVPTDDADTATPAPAADEAAPADAPAEPKEPARATVQASADDAEGQRLAAEAKALRDELTALEERILADEDFDPIGPDAAATKKLEIKVARAERALRDHENVAVQQLREQQARDNQFTQWSLDYAKDHPGRDADGWKAEWNKTANEMSAKYPNVSPESLLIAIQERFEYQTKLLDGRTKIPPKPGKTPPPKHKPPVTPGGARTTPVQSVPVKPGPGPITAMERLEANQINLGADLARLGLS